MNINEFSSTNGVANILNKACENVINEASVCFLNCYEKNLVNIKSFGVDPQGQGYGTKAMQHICNIADNENIDLVLKPTYSNERERLINFYKRFGFEILNPAELIRYSKNN
ncbi:GNAT family N-acetyltransferase [Pectinatus frisingensis]|uniref:GNAT family N-acetyltransferase n=1 Tax=Pectinatus frisingensis TaxID=865 RepID=UPI0018C7794A|nr:GNAT family N-acetyltransferase [Pectinatus frisingensis]